MYDDVNGSDLQSDQYSSGFNTTQGYAPAPGVSFSPNSSAGGFGSAFSTFSDILKSGIGAYAGIEATRLRYAQPGMAQQPPQFVNASRPPVAVQQQNERLVRWVLIGAAVFLVVSSMEKGKA